MLGAKRQRAVVHRPFKARTAIFYQRVEDFQDILRLAEERGAKVEGFMGPSRSSDGFAGIAAKTEKDVLDIVRQLELIQPKGWTPNSL
jgi:hypothetical protein